MDPLRLDLSLQLRSFALELALELGSETFALAGPSGAGKTTLLRALNYLTPFVRGEVRVADVCLVPGMSERRHGMTLQAVRRRVGMVFQGFQLFPHLTVAQNVAFGARAPVAPLLERFGIGHLAAARPARYRELEG